MPEANSEDRMKAFQRKLSEEGDFVPDGLVGPRTHFATQLFAAGDDVEALKALAQGEFEARLRVEGMLSEQTEAIDVLSASVFKTVYDAEPDDLEKLSIISLNLRVALRKRMRQIREEVEDGLPHRPSAAPERMNRLQEELWTVLNDEFDLSVDDFFALWPTLSLALEDFGLWQSAPGPSENAQGPASEERLSELNAQIRDRAHIHSITPFEGVDGERHDAIFVAPPGEEPYTVFDPPLSFERKTETDTRIPQDVVDAQAALYEQVAVMASEEAPWVPDTKDIRGVIEWRHRMAQDRLDTAAFDRWVRAQGQPAIDLLNAVLEELGIRPDQDPVIKAREIHAELEKSRG